MKRWRTAKRRPKRSAARSVAALSIGVATRGMNRPHHLLMLIDRLEKVARGEIHRLAVFMPPGSAKSTYGPSVSALVLGAARHLTCWRLRTPRAGREMGTAGSQLDRRARDLLGIALAEESKAAGRWALTGGEYYAAGVGTGIAGFRADLALIDDPIRSRQDADSESSVTRIWEWYKSDLSHAPQAGRLASS